MQNGHVIVDENRQYKVRHGSNSSANVFFNFFDYQPSLSIAFNYLHKKFVNATRHRQAKAELGWFWVVSSDVKSVHLRISVIKIINTIFVFFLRRLYSGQMPNKCTHHATVRPVIKSQSRKSSTSSPNECGTAPDPTFRLQIKPNYLSYKLCS